MKTLNGLLILMILPALTGCSRPAELDLKPPKIRFNSNSRDTTLVIPQKVQATPPSGNVITSDFFEHLAATQAIGRNAGDSLIMERSQSVLFDFYQNASTHSHVEFRKSPYADFFISKSQADFMSTTANLPEIFETHRKKIFQVIDMTEAQFTFPTKELGLVQALSEISRFFSQFETNLTNSAIDWEIKKAIIGKIYQRFWAKILDAKNIARELESAPDLTSGVEILRKLTRQMDIELEESSQSELATAEAFGNKLNQNFNEASIFNLLIEIWDQMNEADRRKTFGEVSPELFAFLNSNDRKQLDCLQQADCMNLILRLKKDYFILPNIKSYGVARLQSQIRQSAVNSLKEKTSKMATDLIREIPNTLRTSIASELDLEFNRYNGYRKNYSDFARNELQSWFQRRYSTSNIPALESHRLQMVRKTGAGRFGAPPSIDAMEVSADAMASAMSASMPLMYNARAKSFRTKPQQVELIALTRINQLLAYGGFSLADGTPFPALNRSLVSSGPLTYVNIESSLDFPNVFAMPSPTKIKSGFQIPETSAPSQMNILTEARLLHGFNSMVRLFKDWEPSPMGKVLGGIQAKEILTSLPPESLGFPAFPPDAFLALALGNASAILSNLQAKGSPLFILCRDGSPNWGDSKTDCPEPSALAGLVNIVNGKRSSQVSLEAQAEFLDSLLTFLEASERVKETKSQYLRKADSMGKSAIDTLNQATPKLRSLALAMSNFISSVLESETGDFPAYYDLDKKIGVETATVSARLKAIRALAHSGSFFRFKGYGHSAVDAYYALNRNSWDSTTGFYSAIVRSCDLSLAISSLQPLLNVQQDKRSEVQLRQLLKIWRDGLHNTEI